MNFGKFALVIAVARMSQTMADNILVGRMLGTNALGNYALAYNGLLSPLACCFRPEPVLFPAYAEIAADRPQLWSRLYQGLHDLIAHSYYHPVPMFLLADEIVHCSSAVDGPLPVQAADPGLLIPLVVCC